MDLLTYLFTKHCVLFVGDITCLGIDWQNCYAPPHDVVQDVIMDLFISNGFARYVKQPTRQNNILDVVLANDNEVDQILTLCT